MYSPSNITYPRFFIPSNPNYYLVIVYNEIGTARVEKKDGASFSYKNYSSFDKMSVDNYLKVGLWKEVTEEEAALLL